MNSQFDHTSGVEIAQARTYWTRAQEQLREVIKGNAYARLIAGLECLGEVDGEVLLLANSAVDVRRIETDYLDRMRLVWRGIDPQHRRLRVRDRASVEPDVLALAQEAARVAEAAPAPTADPAALEVLEATPARKAPSLHLVPPPNPPAPPTEPPTAPTSGGFDTFAVGEANSAAFALARRIADGGPLPARLSLFCGPAGVGKTHLLEAIARVRAPHGGVEMTTGQELFTEFVDGVRAGSTRAYETRLVSARLLIVDDLHWLQGRSGTQEHFVRIVRDVLAAGASVVLSADRPPADLDTLVPKLRAELRGGVTVELREPDEPLRRDILARKVAEARQTMADFDLPPGVIERLVSRPATGRDLAGVVLNLLTEVSILNRPLTEALVEEVLKRQLGERREPTMEAIRAAVSAHTGISRAELDSPRKQRPLVLARQKAMYLCKRMTTKSYPQIGKRFGNRDHATVMHAVRKIEQLAAEMPSMAADLAAIERRVLQGVDGQ